MRVNIVEIDSGPGLHKDLNAGLGVEDKGLPFFLGRLHSYFVSIPQLSQLYLAGELKHLGHDVTYTTNSISPDSDLVILGMSLISFEEELIFLNRELNQISTCSQVIIFGNVLREASFVERLPLDARIAKVPGDLGELMEHLKLRDEASFAKRLIRIWMDQKIAKSTRYFPMLSLAKTYAVQSSWGCPYPCRYYCPYGTYQGTAIHQRSAEVVASEMRDLSLNLGVVNFLFRDPLFGKDKKWFNSFISELQRLRSMEQYTAYSFAIETRPDIWTVDELTKLYEVGCRSINFGLDTLTESSLERTKRSLKVDESIEMINLAVDLGFFVNVFVVVGFPWEEKKEIQGALWMLRSLKAHLVRVSMATPFSGTEFDQDYGHLYSARTGAFSIQMKESDWQERQREVKAMIRSSLLRFYLSPTRYMRIVWHVLTSNLRWLTK